MGKLLLSEYEKPTKRHYEILLMSWAGWVFDFYDLILYTFLLIPIGKELHFSNVMLSYVLGASLTATAVGGVIFGILSDRYGRKSVLQWTILTYSIGTFFSGIASSFESLIVFRIVTGFGVGGEWAIGQTYVGETFPPNARGRYGAFMQTGAPVGIALASVIGGFVAPAIGWRGCFYISVLPALLVVFIRKRLPESDMWLERMRLIDEGAVRKESLQIESGNKFITLFSGTYRGIFIQSLILSIFDMSAYWFTYSWLPGYLHQERQFSITKSAIWMLVTQAGGFIGYFTFGFVADRFGRRPAYSVYSCIMALGLVMITLMWNVVVVYPTVILGFMFLVGFGTAMGSAFNLARGVQFLTPVIIAVIAKKYGLGGGISLAALFALLTGAWIWTFPETRGRKLAVLHGER